MGLLDDAIREHLDLKRARGADPADIEKMEREALGPVRREPMVGATEYDESGDEPGHFAAEHHDPDQHEPDQHDHERYEDDLFDEHGQFHEHDPYGEAQQLGYHDSTAPHPHAHGEHPSDERDRDAHRSQERARPQPRRRFLRRSRSPAPVEPERTESDRQATEHLAPYDDWHEPATEEHRDEPSRQRSDDPGSLEPSVAPEPSPPEPSTAREPSIAREPSVAPEPSPPEPGTSERAASERSSEPESGDRPPSVEFNRPPRRPRFTAEPAAADAAPPEQPHVHEPHEPTAQPLRAPEPHKPDADEDVLEETPEFLQDTPDHDRLWFEQRPPRDFDFDG